MDEEEIERLIVSVRADTQAFARDVEEMRGRIDGPLQGAADKAGRAIEGMFVRAARTGKFGFEDLRRTALQIFGDIAASAMRSGIDTLLGRDTGRSGGGIGDIGGASGNCCCRPGCFGIGGGRGGGGGMFDLLTGLFGAPGRATGGPVSPGQPYWVGERGPELFVPTSAGNVAVPGGGGAREVRVTITVNASADTAPRALAQSSRQVARAVRAALAVE